MSRHGGGGGRGRTRAAADAEPVRRSVEVEYWVVDDDGELASPSGLLDATDGVEREFVEPLVEVKTTPCATPRELRDELTARLDAVLRRADERGKHLVPLATPLRADEIPEHDSARTRVQNRTLGESFAYVRHCAGTHVHVEQWPGHETDQLNALTALDPALALVNSSPYYRGERVAPGARSDLYRRRAYADFDRQGRLWPYLDDTDDWTRRVESCYEAFTAAARDAGVDPDTVESCFDRESAVWTPVQLRESFPTVEWRSPDAALPSDVLRLANTVAGVVGRVRETDVRIGDGGGRVTDDELVLPAFDAVRDYVDAAIYDGLTADALRDYLDRMGFAVDAYAPTTRAFEKQTLSLSEVRERRLAHARTLEEDVRRTRGVAERT
ncbi:glutamate-cysteine ligase family protein [Salarchaeum japonicum]|uniref:Glutamate--cysteine ligase n=1 Tax=Salarchaeum japonicum TaxID=555573 RepID=A0AAV3SXX0_9EURY|nr:glutamate-cysteine ligase family protein [Salarchaeum japonicum]